MLTVFIRHSLFAALVLLVGCSSQEKELRLKKAAIHFDSGTQSLMAGKNTEALTSLKLADKLDPENAEIIVNLAMAYYFKGDRELAIRYLKKSIELKDDNSDARTNLAAIYYKDGDYAKAEKIWKEILKDLTYDKQARTHYNLGVFELEVKKNNVAAEKYFKAAIKEDDNYCPAYYQLGLIKYKRRSFNSALRNFREASLGTCFESPAPHYYQALTLLELHRFTDARMKFDEIDTRFKKSVYAVRARSKAMEINDLEASFKTQTSHVSKKNLIDESDF